jgi:hypothetical protein
MLANPFSDFNLRWLSWEASPKCLQVQTQNVVMTMSGNASDILA